MGGWDLHVSRQAGGGEAPATATTREGARLAAWYDRDIRWLRALVSDGTAIALRTDGYPSTFTARASTLFATIASRAALDHACGDDEWLIVVAWDAS